MPRRAREKSSSGIYHVVLRGINNWKYSRRGHLFQDRYKSEAVETDKYFLGWLRYDLREPACNDNLAFCAMLK